MFTPGESVDYTWPPELKAELKALPGGYRADPYADGLQGAPFIEQTHFVIRQQELATSHLLDKGDWDLLFSVIQAPDPIQHKFWNVLDPDDPRYDAAKAREHGPALEESYRRCDEVIGDRLAMAERGAFVMVVSDHGFGRYEKNFYLNAVLEQHGLLFRQKSAKKVASKRLSTRSVIDALRRLDVIGLEGRVPHRFRERLARGIDSALSVPIDMDADAGVRGRPLGRERVHLGARAGRPARRRGGARDRGAGVGPRPRYRRADHRAGAAPRGRVRRQRA